ncbi:MAG: right-handed parallel beta-helix repeat-containing protein, partial [Deltaproteobacteria bacterium]|nr:right-handed parallel beta-helix repeat-containing protein [Deltaproteobacteria bacterium]
DGSYAGGDSDGSAEKPWKTIGEAVKAAAPGALVAVAAGAYPEDVLIKGKAVRVWGVCPDKVGIAGTGAGLAAVDIRKGASGSEVGGLAVTGGAMGLLLSGSKAVVVDRVWVRDTAGRGVNVGDVLGPTSVALRGSLVEKNHELGVFVGGSHGTIEGTVVRATLPAASDQTSGRGIGIRDSVTGERATLTLRGSLVEQNHDLGVAVFGSDATIEGTVVRATLPRASDQLFGQGIHVQGVVEAGGRAMLALRGSLVEHNHAVGVIVGGSDASIEGTVVRATLPEPSDQLFGYGIAVLGNADMDARTTLALRGSLVAQNHDVGLLVSGSDATIEGCRIADTLPDGLGSFGDGLVVRSFGRPTSARVVATLIEHSARAALSNFGASVTYGSTLMQCQSFDIEGEPYEGSNFSFDHLGGSLCGCPVANGDCVVVSAGLDPPDLPAPSE